MCFSSLAFATGVNAFGTAVRLDSRFSLPVAIRPVHFGGGRRRTPPLAIHVPRRSLHFVSQRVCEPSIVTVVMKNGPATITARDNVVDRTGELQTWRSGHHQGPSDEGEQTNARYSTPLKTENQDRGKDGRCRRLPAQIRTRRPAPTRPRDLDA